MGNKNQIKKPLTIKNKIIRSAVVIIVLAALVVLGYYVLVWTGAWEYINSVEKIRELILSLGFWGRFAFVIIQFLQVTFLPIPSTISTLAGVLIYGPLQTALLSMAGIMLGSILAFFLGRQFGRKLVVFMVGEQTCQKWTNFLSNAKYSFFVMMVLPVFPDDVLCLVAGLTTMSWKFFVLTNLFARPIGIFLTCYLGSGHLIPYHGWGLIVWGIIIVVTVILLILSFKYREKIENFLKKTFKNKPKTKSIANVDASEEQLLKNQNINEDEKKDNIKKEKNENTKNLSDKKEKLDIKKQDAEKQNIDKKSVKKKLNKKSDDKVDL